MEVSQAMARRRLHFGDRFIPARDDALTNLNSLACTSQEPEEPSLNKTVYSYLLRNELFGDQIRSLRSPPNVRNLFTYQKDDCENGENISTRLSLSPVGPSSEKLLRSPTKPTRIIPKGPFKVLDAPDLQDDFYLSLVDWSSQNVISVGLGSAVYLWSAVTSQVTKLCDLSSEEDSVSSVAWNEKGNGLAIGTSQGTVQLWDTATCKKVDTLYSHSARVGCTSWKGNSVLASGSRDRLILLRDIRESPSRERRLEYHRQEVCGLQWSPDGRFLASGGNDNRVYVWATESSTPLQTYAKHSAAVKAIAWSPHQHGLLASGGGTADRSICFWNTLTGQALQHVDAGSQVCNIVWSPHVASELVSTHGYSQNEIILWNYPSMSRTAQLTGHTFRVLYLALSPTGETIVTGAGDETLRFWKIFSKPPAQKMTKSILSLHGQIR